MCVCVCVFNYPKPKDSAIYKEYTPEISYGTHKSLLKNHE